MRFLLDANMPRSLSNTFASYGAISHVEDIGLATASDNEIASWAKKHNAIVVTRDFDFANQYRMPIKKHAGAIVLKIPSSYSTPEMRTILVNFLATIELAVLQDAVIILEEKKYRIRR